MGAIIKSAGGSTKGGTRGLENYLKQEHKTEKILMYGKDCNISNFAKEFESTRKLYDKTDGRQHIHIIQSWRAGEVTAKQANEIGQEFLKHNKFKEFQAVCITHKDKENIHNHFVINSVSLETGKKYQQTKQEYQELKDYSNEINLKRGIEAEKKIDEKGKTKTYSKNKYQVMKKAFEGKAKSYVLDTAIAVEKSLEKSTSKNNFISEMEKQGYSVKWNDEKKENGEYKNKNITFEDREGNKVRLSNLEKTFSNKDYSREGFEKKFNEREQERELKETEMLLTEYTNNGEKRYVYEVDGKIYGSREKDILIFNVNENCKEFSSFDEAVQLLENAGYSLEKEKIIDRKTEIEKTINEKSKELTEIEKQKEEIIIEISKLDKEKEDVVDFVKSEIEIEKIYLKYFEKEKVEQEKEYKKNISEKISDLEGVKRKINFEETKKINIFNIRQKKEQKENIHRYKTELYSLEYDIKKLRKNFVSLDISKEIEQKKSLLKVKKEKLNEKMNEIEQIIKKLKETLEKMIKKPELKKEIVKIIKKRDYWER